jgi:predicted nucleotidyltransferase
MVKREVAIEIVKDFIKKCEEQQVNFTNVILFGSTVTDSAKDFSDIDVLLASEQFGFDRWDNLHLIVKAKRAYRQIEAHTYPTDYFLKSDPFIEEVKKTGILIK